MKMQCLLFLCAFLTVSLTPLLPPAESLANNQDDKMKQQAPDGAAMKAPLSSLLVRDKEVFAANAKGIFHATKKDKKWSRLPIAKQMPANLVFADVPKDSDHILCFSATYHRDNPDPAQGLYDSTDGGMTWRLISGDYNFQHVLLHRDGSLYAIILLTEKTKEGNALRWKILRAPAIAVPPKWVDISGDIGAGVELLGIFEDPDHDDLVCLNGNCIRDLIIHADDSNYRWKMTRAWEWRKQPETDESFLRNIYRAQTELYMLSATLENYFHQPFGKATRLAGLTIRTKQTNFTFDKDRPKVIPVAIHFLPEKGSVHLLDLRDDSGFWGVKVITPSGERLSRAAKGHGLKKDQKAKQGYRDRKELVTVEIKNGKPYQRSIDLDQLFDFSKPGLYKVLLSYDSVGLTDGDQKEWSGTFGGQVFTVTIR